MTQNQSCFVAVNHGQKEAFYFELFDFISTLLIQLVIHFHDYLSVIFRWLKNRDITFQKSRLLDILQTK